MGGDFSTRTRTRPHSGKTEKETPRILTTFAHDKSEMSSSVSYASDSNRSCFDVISTAATDRTRWTRGWPTIAAGSGASVSKGRAPRCRSVAPTGGEPEPDSRSFAVRCRSCKRIRSSLFSTVYERRFERLRLRIRSSSGARWIRPAAPSGCMQCSGAGPPHRHTSALFSEPRGRPSVGPGTRQMMSRRKSDLLMRQMCVSSGG